MHYGAQAGNPTPSTPPISMLFQSGCMRGAVAKRDECLKKRPDCVFQFSNKKGHFPSLGPHHHADSKTFLIDLPDPTCTQPWTRLQFNHFLAVAKTAAKLLKGKKTIVCICMKGKDRSCALAHAAAILADTDASHIAMPLNSKLCKVLERIRGRVALRAGKRKREEPEDSKESETFDIDSLPNLLSLGRGLLIETDGNLRIIDGQFDGHRVRDLIGCSMFQMLPCTVGKLAGNFEIWLNENGLYDDAINKVATAKLGEQAFGGQLYGNVLVVRKGTIP